MSCLLLGTKPLPELELIHDSKGGTSDVLNM